MAPLEYLGAWGTLIHEKNLKSKISCQTPFKKVGAASVSVTVSHGIMRYWLRQNSFADPKPFVSDAVPDTACSKFRTVIKSINWITWYRNNNNQNFEQIIQRKMWNIVNCFKTAWLRGLVFKLISDPKRLFRFRTRPKDLGPYGSGSATLRKNVDFILFWSKHFHLK